jgi:hypothetical protein
MVMVMVMVMGDGDGDGDDYGERIHMQGRGLRCYAYVWAPASCSLFFIRRACFCVIILLSRFPRRDEQINIWRWWQCWWLVNRGVVVITSSETDAHTHTHTYTHTHTQIHTRTHSQKASKRKRRSLALSRSDSNCCVSESCQNRVRIASEECHDKVRMVLEWCQNGV